MQTTAERNSSGRLYGEVSVVLGLGPSHSGSYSGRRKHAVAVRKQCEARGMPIELAKKSMTHKTTHGTMTTKVYDGDLASEDTGALSGGGVRAREAIESLRSLLVTRVPAAGKLRAFADIKKNDPIRVAFLVWTITITITGPSLLVCGGGRTVSPCCVLR